MENKFEKLRLFFEKIKSITFWDRIFHWKSIRTLSYDAYEEFKEFCNLLNSVSHELEESKNNIAILKNNEDHFRLNIQSLKSDVEHLQEQIEERDREISTLSASVATKDEKIRQYDGTMNKQDSKIASLEVKIEGFNKKISDLEQELTVLKQIEYDRRIEHDKKVATLNKIQERIQDERNKEVEERQREQLHKIETMKESWAKHQDKVKSVIKNICRKYTIEYVDKVPFKGNPDNAIKRCDEFVIFDAKSPASDDLESFPNYIKVQTESIKKYTKQDNVKKDIFLVIPSNSVEAIEQFSFNMGDYSVYIVTLDALEPIILSLRRIEDYEFVNELSPEERENICRIIGRFVHTTKRRVQIDNFFCREFLNTITKCDIDLPSEMKDGVLEYERSEKLNPSVEKRAKQISTKELQTDTKKIQKEAEAKGIIFPQSIQQDIKKLPLSGEEESENSQ